MRGTSGETNVRFGSKSTDMQPTSPTGNNERERQKGARREVQGGFEQVRPRRFVERFVGRFVGILGLP
jgi:hypothetical protein